jgi:hypothetical protein
MKTSKNYLLVLGTSTDSFTAKCCTLEKISPVPSSKQCQIIWEMDVRTNNYKFMLCAVIEK